MPTAGQPHLMEAFIYLQHVLLAGFLLGGPAQRGPPQVHCELWDNLIGLVLNVRKNKCQDPPIGVKLTSQLWSHSIGVVQ